LGQKLVKLSLLLLEICESLIRFISGKWTISSIDSILLRWKRSEIESKVMEFEGNSGSWCKKKLIGNSGSFWEGPEVENAELFK
jgi:hypothetical protein